MDKKMVRRLNISFKVGFTLFEILVAVMIFGVIMLTIFSSFRSFILSSQMIKTNIAASEVAESLSNIIFRDMLSLRVSLKEERSRQNSASSAPNDRDKFRFSGDETAQGTESFSRLRFASLAHIPFGKEINQAAGVARIIYYVRQSGEGGNNQFDLCRSDTLNQFDDFEGDECDPVMCKNITKFKLTYIDIKGDEHSEWDSESDEFEYGMPISVGIEIEFNVLDSLQKFSTAISLPPYPTTN
ncbi:MAG: type II secretion system protein [Desulfamplus sp.]|nr:type II secretion system protein [Desulfamplus sp.]